MRPTVAIIFAAGTGTRMLPVTAAVQKELLPILNRPIIDYTVADCVAAGIKRIIFVIRPGQTGIKNYYLGNPGLEAALARLGKTDALASLKKIQTQATYEFIEQPDDAGYGTAIPLRTALDHLAGEGAVVVSAGDDAVWQADGTNEMAAFISAFAASGAEGAIMGLPMTADQLSHYGALTSKTTPTGSYLTGILEKPAPGSASGRLANISKYILTESARTYVRDLKPNPQTGEYYLTDAITAAAQKHQILIYATTGSYLDTGNPANWLAANQRVAAADQH